MGKLNSYQNRQILISFSIQTLSHTLINNLNCRSLANKNAFSIYFIKYWLFVKWAANLLLWAAKLFFWAATFLFF
jgi:hypothetical protein